MDFKSRYKYNTDTDLLGKGGFARVYKAYDTLLDREVAIKVFNAYDGNIGSVLNEIKKASKLSHPNLLTYYDVSLMENVNAFGETEKIEIGVMEYANGGDLKNFMRYNEDKALFIKILKEILSGLSYLHSKGMIHRDLKAQNILLMKEGNTVSAKISDFGISKVIDNDAASNSSMVGTIEYMAPEQFEPKKYGIDGRISTNMDIWAFGIMLYELITDKKPFGQRGGDTTAEEIMQRILTTALPSDLNSISEPFRSVISQCLVADAKKRITDCSVLITILDGKSPATLAPGTESKRPKISVSEEETQVFDRSHLTKNKAEPIPATSRKQESPPPPPPTRTSPIPAPQESDENEKTGSKAPVIVVVLLLISLMGISAYYFLVIRKGNASSFETVKQLYQSDPDAALIKMHDLARQQDKKAIRFLGDFFWDAQARDSAYSYYSQLDPAVDKGIAGRIGSILYTGSDNVPNDTTKAWHLFEVGAQEGDTFSCMKLGEIYYLAKGGASKDNAAAIKWFKKAAESGCVQAMESLYAIYTSDNTRNSAEAFKWIKRAADMNWGEAKFYLASCYTEGIGVPRDMNQAIQLYKEASKQGIKEATNRLAELGQ